MTKIKFFSKTAFKINFFSTRKEKNMNFTQKIIFLEIYDISNRRKNLILCRILKKKFFHADNSNFFNNFFFKHYLLFLLFDFFLPENLGLLTKYLMNKINNGRGGIY